MFDPLGPLGDFEPKIQRYRDYARQRQMTLGDLLLENRIIFLAGVINEASGIETVMKMLYLQYENRTQDIHFYISSPGGAVTATLQIYDTMQFLECPVATYCLGLAASGGAILLAGGTKGKRFALTTPRSWSISRGARSADRCPTSRSRPTKFSRTAGV